MPALFRTSAAGFKAECAGDVQKREKKQSIVVMHTKNGTQTCETDQSKIRQFDAIFRHLSTNEDDSHFKSAKNLQFVLEAFRLVINVFEDQRLVFARVGQAFDTQDR